MRFAQAAPSAHCEINLLEAKQLLRVHSRASSVWSSYDYGAKVNRTAVIGKPLKDATNSFATSTSVLSMLPPR